MVVMMTVAMMLMMMIVTLFKLTCPTIGGCWLMTVLPLFNLSGMVGVDLPSSFVSIPTQRFCFDTDMFLTACTCDHEIATCEENPCSGASCTAFPEAKCHISFCGRCQARWILEGREVDCSETRGVRQTTGWIC